MTLLIDNTHIPRKNKDNTVRKTIDITGAIEAQSTQMVPKYEILKITTKLHVHNEAKTTNYEISIKTNMNYISKVFSPRVNITRLDKEEVVDTIPLTNFENSTMEHSEQNQAFIRSQGSTGVDLNNIGDPPSGVRNRKKMGTESSKSSTVNFVI